jgi:uncharacterized membrane protein (UPF0127 family)
MATIRWLFLAIALVVLSLAWAQGNRAQFIVGSSYALAGSETLSADLSPKDIAHATEVRHLITTHSHEVWPGWSEAPPLLLRKGGYEYLIGHPAPPASFERLEIAGAVIYRLSGHLTPAPVATSWPVEGIWSVAIPTHDEFQVAIDAALGPGVVVLDDPTYIRAVVHEAFHVYQLNTLGGPQQVPLFDQQDNKREAMATLMALAGVDSYHVALGQALAEALEAPTIAETLEAASAFLNLRLEWRESIPMGVVAFEKTVEWLEGMARYADTRMMLLTAEEQGYPRAEEVWRNFLASLRNPTDIPGTVRDRYFVFGAAQGFLLDRLLPGWKEQVLAGKASLEELLERAVMGDAGIPEPLKGVELETVWLDGVRWRVAVADVPERWGQGLSGITEFGALDGLLFVFPEDIMVKFWTKGALMPLDIAFFAEDGSLVGLEHMSICLDDPCPVYGPEQAYRYALEAAAASLTALPATARLERSQKE